MHPIFPAEIIYRDGNKVYAVVILDTIQNRSFASNTKHDDVLYVVLAGSICGALMLGGSMVAVNRPWWAPIRSTQRRMATRQVGSSKWKSFVSTKGYLACGEEK
eukprot:scaffold502846_cov48-Prasinocladus_malaysianus.AAC.1